MSEFLEISNALIVTIGP